jgi:hypothetical protein
MMLLPAASRMLSNVASVVVNVPLTGVGGAADDPAGTTVAAAMTASGAMSSERRLVMRFMVWFSSRVI